MSTILNGIRVVELGTHVAIPKASRVLAQWGAESIKVEPPKGEAWRTMGRLWNMPYSVDNNPILQSENANKKSLALNLKSEEGKEALLKLLDTTDVFMTNTRPKALRKLGIDYETIKERYPRLIYVTLSGYGENGPDKDDPGFDIAAFWARSGVCVEWTEKGQKPFKPHPGFGDTATSWSIVSAILAALIHRGNTGTGEFIQTSLYGNALWCNSSGIAMSQRGHSYPKAAAEGTNPFSPLYQSKEGDWILISNSAYDTSAADIFRMIGQDECAKDPNFTQLDKARQHLGEVIEKFQEGFGQMSTADIMAGLKSMDIVNMKLRNPAEITKDAQAWENGYLQEVTLECGESLALPVCPLSFENADTLEFKLAPHLGADTREILASLGYTPEQIQAMGESGAVRME